VSDNVEKRFETDIYIYMYIYIGFETYIYIYIYKYIYCELTPTYLLGWEKLCRKQILVKILDACKLYASYHQN